MDELAAYERRFRSSGLPLFIEDYSAREDVFTRATPFLTLVFLGEMLGAIQLDWSLLANVGAALGGLAVLVTAFGLVNRFRERPFWCFPQDVGRVELAAFVLLPALMPLIFGGQLESAAATAAGNGILLLVVSAVVGYGLLSIVRWASRRLLGQLRASLNLLTRPLHLLLVFTNVLFVTGELWQSMRTMPTSFALLLVGLISVVGGSFVGGSFLLARIPREVKALERQAGSAGPALGRRQRLKVALVMLVSQGLQIVLVGLAVFAFFAAVGLLMVNAEVRRQFMGSSGHVVLRFHLLGESVQVTRELLRVCAGVGVFSGFYWAVAVLTDRTYREEFLDNLTHEMTDTFRARAEYLALRAGVSG